MLAIVPAERAEDTPPAQEDREAALAVFYSPKRHGYAPSAANRLFAFAATSLIYVVAGTILFLTFEAAIVPPKTSAALMVSLSPLASPSETPPKRREALKPVEKHERRPLPQKVDTIVSPKLAIVTLAARSPAPTIPVDPTPPQPETASPKTAPAPPAPQVSSNAPDTWEGRVLARLQKYQRYPGEARSARQQGVAYIRFRMNRDGQVLSSSLVRSSGFPVLDQAALDMLRRADPLPKIPPERPDQIELLVPVDFYIH